MGLLSWYKNTAYEINTFDIHFLPAVYEYHHRPLLLLLNVDHNYPEYAWREARMSKLRNHEFIKKRITSEAPQLLVFVSTRQLIWWEKCYVLRPVCLLIPLKIHVSSELICGCDVSGIRIRRLQCIWDAGECADTVFCPYPAWYGIIDSHVYFRGSSVLRRVGWDGV